MKKLHIMHVILDLYLAGAQEVVRTLVNYSQRHDCVVTVCSFRDGPMRSKIEALGTTVHILNRPEHDVTQLPLFLADLKQIRNQLVELVETHQVDVIQTHLLEVLDFVCLKVRDVSSLKAVFWTIHNVEPLPTMPSHLLPAKRFVYRWLYHRLSKEVDGIIAVSDEVAQAVATIIKPPSNKISTINNGVDVEQFQQSADKATLCQTLGLAKDSALLLTVGRLTEQKGHCYLIDAARQIISHHAKAHFLFVGTGELQESLQSQATETGHGDHFYFLGNRTDIPQLLAVSDLFILPSLWEGLSIALLEAMAAAKPIIATAVSGTTQVIRPNQTGFLVPAKNSHALAEAINTALTNSVQAQMFGLVARQYVVDHYSANKQALEHITLYKQASNYEN
ncbi:glycosyltransferase [Anaerolineales bacterium HSG6]|nr:glycosyltransferase [Anaerolineales bacterium HSG6]